jgi:hypothetical protein
VTGAPEKAARTPGTAAVAAAEPGTRVPAVGVRIGEPGLAGQEPGQGRVALGAAPVGTARERAPSALDRHGAARERVRDSGSPPAVRGEARTSTATVVAAGVSAAARIGAGTTVRGVARRRPTDEAGRTAPGVTSPPAMGGARETAAGVTSRPASAAKAAGVPTVRAPRIGALRARRTGTLGRASAETTNSGTTAPAPAAQAGSGRRAPALRLATRAVGAHRRTAPRRREARVVGRRAPAAVPGDLQALERTRGSHRRQGVEHLEAGRPTRGHHGRAGSTIGVRARHVRSGTPPAADRVRLSCRVTWI